MKVRSPLLAAVRIVSVNDVYELQRLPQLCTLLKQMKQGPHRTLSVLNGDFLSPSILVDASHTLRARGRDRSRPGHGGMH